MDANIAGGSSEKGPAAENSSTGRANASPRAVRSVLNRLIVAGCGEIIALDAAARIIDGGERRARLREQVQRRLIFQKDLAAAVTGLGGIPAAHATGGARLAEGARRMRELVIGPHAPTGLTDFMGGAA